MASGRGEGAGSVVQMINTDCVKVFDMKQVWDELTYQVIYPVRDQVRIQLWNELRSKVHFQVWYQCLND